jgi:uncharacterized membrane protein YccC
MTRPGMQLLFSANSFAAAMLALYIGFSLGLPRPYWAMATAYIVSQPLSGPLRSKGVYRLVGTLLGATAALALIPPLANAPILLSIALALWVGFCLFVSLLDRTPRSYVFLLAGYTAAIIGFPVAPQPAEVFSVAVTRVVEIGLGVICATLVHTLVFPQPIGPVLNQRIERWLRDLRAWTVDALTGAEAGAHTDARRRLAADAIEIRILSSHLPFDTSNLRETRQLIGALQDEMTLLLPLISAVADRTAVLREAGPLPPPLQTLLDEMTIWANDTNAPRAQGTALIDQAAALAPTLGVGADWAAVMTDNLLDRLRQLILAVQDVRDLRFAIGSGETRLPSTLNPLVLARGRTVLHLDPYLAFLSAVAASGAVLVCCAIWIITGWPEGSVAALSAAVFCSFFATQDDPAPAIASFTWFTIVSLPIVAAYQFAILPAIDGFPMLTLALAPTLLIVGYLIADPRFTSRALPVAIGVANGLALAETFSADFAGFINVNVAQVIGLVAALLVTRLCRSVGADWSLRRILRAGWRDLARIAAAPNAIDRMRFMIHQLDRTGLATQRLVLTPPAKEFTGVDALADLRIGINLQDLHGAAADLPPSGGQAAHRLLSGLATHFRSLSRGGAGRLTPELLSELDLALTSAAGASGAGAATLTSPSHAGLRALVGLRRNLFPSAAPYRPAPLAELGV